MVFMGVVGAFSLFFLTMSVGVLFGRKPIAGSCGGLAQVGLNGECKVCGKTPGACDTEIAMNTSLNGAQPKFINAMAATQVAPQIKSQPATAGHKQFDLVAELKRARRAPDPLDF